METMDELITKFEQIISLHMMGQPRKGKVLNSLSLDECKEIRKALITQKRLEEFYDNHIGRSGMDFMMKIIADWPFKNNDEEQ